MLGSDFDDAAFSLACLEHRHRDSNVRLLCSCTSSSTVQTMVMAFLLSTIPSAGDDECIMIHV